jgi:hypothetical protein
VKLDNPSTLVLNFPDIVKAGEVPGLVAEYEPGPGVASFESFWAPLPVSVKAGDPEGRWYVYAPVVISMAWITIVCVSLPGPGESGSGSNLPVLPFMLAAIELLSSGQRSRLPKSPPGCLPLMLYAPGPGFSERDANDPFLPAIVKAGEELLMVAS